MAGARDRSPVVAPDPAGADHSDPHRGPSLDETESGAGLSRRSYQLRSIAACREDGDEQGPRRQPRAAEADLDRRPSQGEDIGGFFRSKPSSALDRRRTLPGPADMAIIVVTMAQIRKDHPGRGVQGPVSRIARRGGGDGKAAGGDKAGQARRPPGSGRGAAGPPRQRQEGERPRFPDRRRVGRGVVIVLDTHAWIWWVAEPEKLSARARHRSTRPRLWACARSAAGRWPCSSPSGGSTSIAMSFSGYARLSRVPRVTLLPLTPEICVSSASLAQKSPADPADRLIAASALEHQAPIVTKDSRLRSMSQIETVW